MPMINSLSITQVFTIKSSLTRRLYLDDAYAAHLFFTKESAETFAEGKDAFIDGPDYTTREDILSAVYACGGKEIVLHGDDFKKEERVSPGKKDLIRSFYNHELSGNFNLLVETRKKAYLDKLKDGRFIVPLRIRHDEKTKKMQITYGVVMSKDKSSFYYLCFTDLDRYKMWATKQPGWEPLLVTFETMCQIGKRKGYIVNIMDEKIPLHAEYLKGGVN